MIHSGITSNPFTAPKTSLLLNSQRQLIRKQAKAFLEFLNVNIDKIRVLTNSSLDQNQREIKTINFFDELVKNVETQNNKGQLASTFYENRYGFSENELKKSEYSDLNTNAGHSHLLGGILKNNQSRLLNSTYLSQSQRRGFKTKRNAEAVENDKSFVDMIKARIENETMRNKAKHSTIENLMNSSSTSKKGLGSIFHGSGHKETSKVSGLDDKVKIAFAEGLLYADTQKKSGNVGVFRFLFIMITVILIASALFPPLLGSIISKDNGKNGGSGINIRSLTGSVNYEVNPEDVTIRFDDVKGLPEAKQELLEIVDFLKNPDQYTKLGARLPKGVLLVGPPGCGKTLLAKSVAGEAGVPFFQASGSDFDEMFVGTGSKRVRSLFKAAREKAPCVIFIDEIDSVGSTRTNSAVHPHANQTINQLLAEMDGFQKNEGVIVLGATNRRETLDPALMRPGRFDSEVRIDKPDLKQRIQILEFYLEKVAADPDIDVEYLAKQLNGLGGSAIENVVNQGALRAVVSRSNSVKMEHLEYALDKTLMGYGKDRLADEETNKNTAYHEAGHVLVAYYTKDSHPLHKVTILPRAKSLGHTAFVPENDMYSRTKSQLLAQMDVAMGGRVAEELIFGADQVTTGASGDFQAATQIAQQMVTYFGMNEKVGIRYMGNEKQSELSPQTQELLDHEIKKSLNDSYDRAKNILKTHSRELKLLANALLDKETLDAEQIKKIIEN